MFLMPSRFEPCGLSQLIAMRYGCVPIVRSVGGLADTVQEFNPRTGEGNGFAFINYDPWELFAAIVRPWRSTVSRHLAHAAATWHGGRSLLARLSHSLCRSLSQLAGIP